MNSLDLLAQRCGIEETFKDALGKTHSTSPDTKRSLLAAMLIDASGEEQARASIEELDRKEWSRTLPPVLVAYAESGPVCVPVTLPRERRTVRWSLKLEDGGVRSSESELSGLTLEAESPGSDGIRERRTLVLGEGLPFGYHQLTIETEPVPMPLIVTPGRCWLPHAMEKGHALWGLAAQLYLLRSAHNWGIGDFTDLTQLIDLAKENGCDVVGLNPLHAMFLDEPENASPYSPADRLLLNVLNIDMEAVPGFGRCAEAQDLVRTEEFQRKLTSCREASLVDYKEVAALKLEVLDLLFASFDRQEDQLDKADLDDFHEERRDLLDRACLFQALRQHFTEKDPELSDCRRWPEEYRSFDAPGVARFAEEHPDLLRFHLWLQWIADRQLERAAGAAEPMEIGIYRDLAVGAHPSGAEVWSRPATLVSNAQVGAPPDIWNPAGQNWGLPPFHPQALRAEGYRSFIDLIRANMRYAGGLRIDHVMALMHLYWIPEGSEPKDGAYVRYPMEDMVGILALESHRQACLVVGEDLGTVPEGFRERMADANILSYRVLFFERERDGFIPPDEYPPLSLGVASSHDLPTLHGWWKGSDLDLKERLHLFPTASGCNEARETRASDREDLVRALDTEGLLPAADGIDAERFSEAAHRYLARSRSLLTLVQIDDLTLEIDQVNVPATTGENPNWRRRLSADLDAIASDPRLAKIADVFRAERQQAPPVETREEVSAD